MGLVTGLEFAKKYLESKGWQSGEGLGKDKTGIATPLKVNSNRTGVGVGFDHSAAAKEEFKCWWTDMFNAAVSSVTVKAEWSDDEHLVEEEKTELQGVGDPMAGTKLKAKKSRKLKSRSVTVPDAVQSRPEPVNDKGISTKKLSTKSKRSDEENDEQGKVQDTPESSRVGIVSAEPNSESLSSKTIKKKRKKLKPGLESAQTNQSLAARPSSTQDHSLELGEEQMEEMAKEKRKRKLKKRRVDSDTETNEVVTRKKRRKRNKDS